MASVWQAYRSVDPMDQWLNSRVRAPPVCPMAKTRSPLFSISIALRREFRRKPPAPWRHRLCHRAMFKTVPALWWASLSVQPCRPHPPPPLISRPSRRSSRGSAVMLLSRSGSSLSSLPGALSRWCPASPGSSVRSVSTSKLTPHPSTRTLVQFARQP